MADKLSIKTAVENTDLTRFRLTHSTKFVVLRDRNGNASFELRFDTVPFMAFLFRNYAEKNLNWKREVLARLTYPLGDYPIKTEEALALIPIEEVDSLPEREWWQLNSTMGEDLFWCDSNISLEVTDIYRDFTYLYIHGHSRSYSGSLAYMQFAGKRSDDEKLLSFALDLRKKLHLSKVIRVASEYHKKTISWYIPAPKIL